MTAGGKTNANRPLPRCWKPKGRGASRDHRARFVRPKIVATGCRRGDNVSAAVSAAGAAAKRRTHLGSVWSGARLRTACSIRIFAQKPSRIAFGKPVGANA
jgi:hypothetical protein